MKSLLVSVFWPTWEWTFKPHLQFLCASYADSLATRDAVQSRRLINSPWYQSYWAPIFQLTSDQNMKTRYENDRSGHRIATSVGGLGTGEGGDRLVADDPHKVREAESELMREAVLTWWDETMSTRGNDPKTVAKIVIMQRVHAHDLTGHLLESGDYHHLCLPAEFEPRTHLLSTPTPPSSPSPSLPQSEEIAHSPGLDTFKKGAPRERGPLADLEDLENLADSANSGLDLAEFARAPTRATDPEPHDNCAIHSDPRTRPGELLAPLRFGPAELLDLKKALGTPFAIAGQLQQRPVPREGALFKSDWFRPIPPDLDLNSLRIIQMWDLAYSARQSADYTAALTAGIDQNGRIYLLYGWRTRVQELPDLQEDDVRGLGGALIRHISSLSPPPALVGIWSGAFEKRLATQVLCVRVMRSLHQKGKTVRVVSIPETSDKVMRAQLPAGMAELGEIYADLQAPWWPGFLAELLEFPKSAHDDYVDVLSGVAHLAVLLAATERREGPIQLTMGAHARAAAQGTARLSGFAKFHQERLDRQKARRVPARIVAATPAE